MSLTEQDGLCLSADAMAELFATRDFQEGPAAFIEKRPPVWSGE
jgi:hypothetical protein